MKPLLIADGLIATTELIRDLLRRAYGEDVDVLDAPRLHEFRPGDTRPIFISRLCHPRFSWFPQYLNERGIPYVYFLDDNFFELLPEYDAYNGAFFSHPVVHASLTNFLERASLVWLMSQPLRSSIEARCRLRACYTGHGAVDVDLFDRYMPDLNAERAGGRPIRVGYPTSRRPAVTRLLTDIVCRSADRFGDKVQFEFVGWCPDAVVNMPNATLFPGVADYDRFVAFMQGRCWDMGLAPAGDSPFENCKTSVKFREYGAARIAGIYSDVALYSSSVTNGQTGLLVPNEAEAWVAAIERLIEHPEQREHIARSAYAFVRQHHDIGRVAQDLRVHVDPVFAQ